MLVEVDFDKLGVIDMVGCCFQVAQLAVLLLDMLDGIVDFHFLAAIGADLVLCDENRHCSVVVAAAGLVDTYAVGGYVLFVAVQVRVAHATVRE